jgi:hypothetical protein
VTSSSPREFAETDSDDVNPICILTPIHSNLSFFPFTPLSLSFFLVLPNKKDKKITLKTSSSSPSGFLFRPGCADLLSSAAFLHPWSSSSISPLFSSPRNQYWGFGFKGLFSLFFSYAKAAQRIYPPHRLHSEAPVFGEKYFKHLFCPFLNSSCWLQYLNELLLAERVVWYSVGLYFGYFLVKLQF